MFSIEIDLKGVKETEELIKSFYVVLQLPYDERNTFSSWEALNDWMRSLDSSSKIISRMNPVPDHVHLIIKNYNDVKVLNQVKQGNYGTYNDFHVFNEILIELTDNHSDIRGTGGRLVNIKITFEVHHGDY
jgi:hypothetical protein